MEHHHATEGVADLPGVEGGDGTKLTEEQHQGLNDDEGDGGELGELFIVVACVAEQEEEENITEHAVLPCSHFVQDSRTQVTLNLY